jgi:6-phosphogluconate dehydrogenase
MPQLADIGVIGLAVMGRNLALNIADHGFRVSVFNRTTEKVVDFLAGEADGADIVGTSSLEEFVASLEPPRRMILMIKAGDAVDAQLDTLTPLLETGDIVIDGGNSLFTDTARRVDTLGDVGIRFVGAGISGGELGARFGPSIMPGGSIAAWPEIQPVLQAIAAHYDGEPTAEWIGPGGSGHYVKMVHNGIEYGDMQVIAEAYDIMYRGLGMTAGEIQPVFALWNQGKLDSYLVEITADIMGYRDGGAPTLDHILDAASQKGTGKWTVISSMDQGIPVTLVAEAVYARMLSALKTERMAAAEMLPGPPIALTDEPTLVIDDLHDALYASKIVSYTQGFMLLRAASVEFGWDIDLGTVASLWRAGCVIRSRFLDDITSAYRTNPGLPSLLLDPFFRDEIAATLPGWRRTVERAVGAGLPVPAYASALGFYDGYRSERLPANLIQAQRDYFGAHTYERSDRPRGEYFHTDWTGRGGGVTAGTYKA